MLTKKETSQPDLSAVKKTSAKIIKLKKPAEDGQTVAPQEQQLQPPLDKFNTGYLKARENDPL